MAMHAPKSSVSLDWFAEAGLTEIREKLGHRLGTKNRSLLLRFAVHQLKGLSPEEMLAALDRYFLERGSAERAAG